MTARNQPADTTPRSRDRQRLHFSAPAAASIVAVVAVAVVAAMLLFGPQGLIGIGLGPSPTPTPSPEALSTGPSAAPTTEPTSEPSVAPTPNGVPTAQPTPQVETWVGLEWSEPIDPSVGVNDAIWWEDRYVGVGSVALSDEPSSGMTTIVPLILSSQDGVNWDVVQELEPMVDEKLYDFYLTEVPETVVRAGDGLLAMGFYGWGGGPRTLWQSSDGVTWTRIESQSWLDAWQGATVGGIAGGPAGVIAIGAEGSGCCMNPAGEPIVLFSTDGSEWEHVAPRAPAPAKVSDVASFGDGFVIGGRVGERDGTDDDWGHIGTGVAAVWSSPDGRTWTAATLEGVEPVRGGRLWEFAVGAEGLLALGFAGPVDAGYGEAALSGWASSDGLTWRYVGETGDELPPIRSNFDDVVSDGTRMLALAPEARGSLELAGWTSLDGVTWTRLTFTGSQAPLRSQPLTEEEVAQLGATPVLGSARLMRDGIVAGGSTPLGSNWDGPSEGTAWVARAVVGD